MLNLCQSHFYSKISCVVVGLVQAMSTVEVSGELSNHGDLATNQTEWQPRCVCRVYLNSRTVEIDQEEGRAKKQGNRQCKGRTQRVS